MAAKTDQAIQLLRSQDAAKRRKAIVYLTKSDEAKAIKALAWSYKNDPDPNLRDLARKGRATLKKRLGSADDSLTPESDGVGAAALLAYHKRVTDEVQRGDSAFAFDGDSDDNYANEDYFGGMFARDNDEDARTAYNAPHDPYADEDDEDEMDSMFALDDDEDYGDGYTDEEVGRGPVNLSAKKHIDRALDFHIDQEDAAALEELGKAYDKDPRTMKDTQAMNIAGSIIGLSGEDAMRVIASPVKRANFIERIDAESGSSRNGSVGWNTAWADIGIFALINAAGSTILVLLGANRFVPALQSFSTAPEYQSFLAQPGNEDVIAFLLSSLTSGLIVLILFGLLIMLFNLVATFVQAFLLHVVATAGFSGEGAIAATVDRTFNVASLYYGLTFALLIGIVFALPVDAAVYQNIEGNANAFSLANTLNQWVSPLLNLGYVILLGFALGQVQRFGMGKGCLSVFVYTVGLMIFGCGCGFLLTFAGLFSAPTGAGF